MLFYNGAFTLTNQNIMDQIFFNLLVKSFLTTSWLPFKLLENSCFVFYPDITYNTNFRNVQM